MVSFDLPDVPDSVRYAFEMAVAAALFLPALYLWAGKVDLQVLGTPEAYLLRTSLLIAAGLLVVTALFVPLMIRARWPRYVHSFLVLLYGINAFKAGMDLWLDVTVGARTLAGAPGAPALAWLPAWFVDLVAVFVHVLVLWWLVQPETMRFVREGPEPHSA